MKPRPRPWLATCRAVTQPVRRFHASTGVSATKAATSATIGPRERSDRRLSGASQR